jgi:phosphoenolpyruvate carboxykinase (GTP)
VLKWVFERVDGKSEAQRTPIGLLPPTSAIDTSALDVPKHDLEEILSVDVAGWSDAIEQIKQHYASFDGHVPTELHTALATLERELAA